MRARALTLAVLMLLASFVGCLGFEKSDGLDNEEETTTPLRINHVQMKGTHNSYHVKPTGPTIRDYDYSHEPLDTQAEEFDVRQFEIDVWWSPGQQLRVYHNQYDRGTTCQTLQQCLGVLLEWSDSSPNHVPLMIWIEPKEWTWEGTDTTTVLDAQSMLEDVEEQINLVWPKERIIIPDDVRGEHTDVSTAVTTSGWPLLDESRGKAIFVLLGGGDLRDDYHSQFPNLEGATMFTMSVANTPEAAIFSNTNPIGDAEEIRALVEAGYIVRSRADSAGNGEADNNDTERKDAAIEIGAHTISTDYPSEVDGIEYWVDLSIRCNPISAPEDCSDEDIE
ncbi:MAG: hypothetical protein CXX81_03795 [Methanobacteriota archaeon]|nr:MAG: hypothetical protein CXX81_27680 [Euryarchaeota archaeon]HIA25580.1 hypothetical protein [Candidatus Poseidoniales archaeon]PXY76459.1 MAG: hypothetical protein CXX81_14730 [Euryarchaeota archaeon]PXY79215.1 MAG: hypothetical protein CXX81_03795 [Euryarchaeota archaeon]HIB41811.1 hypothetical protein [Candidatus Poseidoniales archaeon]